MRRISLAVAVTLIAGLPTAAGGRSVASGISGRTVEGPTCPVERNPPDPQCAPRPLQARVRITKIPSHQGGSTRSEVVRSDADGHFQARLRPGLYDVRGLATSSSGYPRPPADQHVRVYAARFTHITLNYDTGIR